MRAAARWSRSRSPRACPASGTAAPPAQPRVVDAASRRRAGVPLHRAAGRQRFERFEWAAVRYAQLTVRNAPRGLRIRHVGSTFTHYPAEHARRLRVLRSVARTRSGRSAATRCCSACTTAGRTARAASSASGSATRRSSCWSARSPSARASTRSTASSSRHAAESQRPDGLTQMFAPGDHHTDAILIPDWTLQWILNAEQHWLYTGELEVDRGDLPRRSSARWPGSSASSTRNDLVAEPALLALHGLGGARPRAARRRRSTPSSSARCAPRRDSRDALESPRAARRYDGARRPHRAPRSTRATGTRGRGVYVDVVDPATRRAGSRASRSTPTAPRSCGTSRRAQRWASIVERITDPARAHASPPRRRSRRTASALDPESGVVLANTFYSHFVYRALCQGGALRPRRCG